MSKPIGALVLEDAIKILENPANWTQKRFVRWRWRPDPNKGFFQLGTITKS